MTTNRTRWERPALIGLLLATGLLYLWGLDALGWANPYYASAVQAGSDSWKAFFFGSSDAGNAITVDKPPASLWVMALSVRVFGLSSWSILVPQALMGVASVGVLYATVRRWFSPAAALLAGLALAVTPVATLMFRYNNPDALLVLLLTLAAYATVRALERASTKWVLVVGLVLGFAFLTKMLQALLIVPALALVYLIAAPTTARKRIGQLLLAGASLVGCAGWWIAIVELVPASARPYIGATQTNSILELTIGYNGLGRLTGGWFGGVGGSGSAPAGPGSGSGFGAEQAGPARLFVADIGGQISWLLPAGLAFLVLALWFTRKRPRTDRFRAGFVLWGGWVLCAGGVLSLMEGIFHPYYTVILAPAIAGLVGIGAVWLWRLRSHTFATLALAGTVAVTGVWSYVLLARSPDFQPWLRPVVLVAALSGAGLLLLASRSTLPVVRLTVAIGLVAALLGPIAFSLETVATPQTRAVITAGPPVAGIGVRPVGPANRPAGEPPGPADPSDQVTALLAEDADSYTWVAATVGSNQGADYQLESGQPVMAIGGFIGSDPYPTLEQFQAYVDAGEIHYFLASEANGNMPANGRNGHAAEVTRWVERHFTPTTVDGVTLYDLTGGGSDVA